MKPLRIEWRLASPLARSSVPTHLDSLIAYAVTQRRLQEMVYTRPAQDMPIRELARELPLEREVRGEDWVWKASMLLPDVQAHGMGFWTKKFDAYDYAKRYINGETDRKVKLPMEPFAINIDTERGIFKAQFKYFPIAHVSTVVAWCVGDEDEIRDLLDPANGLVTHIGPRGHRGFGRIAAFSIEEDEDGATRWSSRVLPWQEDGLAPIDCAVRPPYSPTLAPENIVQAFINPALLG
jgi:CRISPR type IV-associated protein Csf3